MHRVIWGQGNAALIAGILVVLVSGGLLRLLWLYLDAPIIWVILAAWLLLPLMPFALRLLSILLLSPKRGTDGIC